MPKVYILNKGSHDYSAAEKHGDILYVTDGNLSRYDVNQMYRECMAAMQDSEPDDFILITSLATLCAVATSLFVYKHKRLNLLIHKDDGYIKRLVVFDN